MLLILFGELSFGQMWKKCGRIWPDWGNTARLAMAGLGSIGLKENHALPNDKTNRTRKLGISEKQKLMQLTGL